MKIVFIFIILLSSCIFNKGIYINSFYIDKDNVTIAQFEECINSKRCNIENVGIWSGSYYDNCSYKNTKYDTTSSINCITWNGAKEYCEWQGKRLPTRNEILYIWLELKIYGGEEIWTSTPAAAILTDDLMKTTSYHYYKTEKNL